MKKEMTRLFDLRVMFSSSSQYGQALSVQPDTFSTKIIQAY